MTVRRPAPTIALHLTALILQRKEVRQVEDKKLPLYEVPEVTTYTDEEILEELGPAQACYGNCDFDNICN
jgi:hypothetical protein